MRTRIFQVFVMCALLLAGGSRTFSQSSSELKSFLGQKMGLSQEQITAIHNASHLPRISILAAPLRFLYSEWST
jgi:hypothetical protein